MLLLLMAAINLSAQLTYRGGSEFPAEQLLVKFQDWQLGDTIFSAYLFEGQLYASWMDVPKPSSTGQFFIRAMRDNNLQVQTGLKQGEEAFYLLKRNGQFTYLTVNRTKLTDWWGEAVLIATDVRLTLNDNLYYSLCPEFPDVASSRSRYKPKAGEYVYFYKILTFNEFMPLYTSAVIFEVKTGTGKLFPAKTTNYYRYQFTSQDIARGFITLKMKATPLKNCSGEFEKEIIIEL